MDVRIAAVSGIILILGAVNAQGANDAAGTDDAATKVAVELCSACHGPGGSSTSSTFPILAGQREQYLAAQLRAFKSKDRADPEAHDYMWGMAASVPDSLIDGLARYFASQPPPQGRPGDPALVAEGKKLFENGDKAKNVSACSGCHGADAEGNSVFPRLAGQHAAYIVRQLEVIQKNLRASPVMHGIITQLTPNQIKAIAAFLQSR
ncbi:MAG: c-type cytochrome [Syntrophales bacterium]